ncbi:SbtR family transcriptional regulator [Nocardiopsis protaetiae]|uniref:SbtR family transcriptional regulator n=1 Tax=Nocardiopsis protaetiae TaxID=3382270 RepID=UPI00387A9065
MHRSAGADAVLTPGHGPSPRCPGTRASAPRGRRPRRGARTRRRALRLLLRRGGAGRREPHRRRPAAARRNRRRLRPPGARAGPGAGTPAVPGLQAGTVRPGLETGDVVALLTAVCHGALHSGWDDRTRARALGVVFAGMRADRA